MQAGTSLLPHVNCNGAVMRHIPPPNNSSSFEVSAIFSVGEIGDVFCLWKSPGV